MFFEFRNRNRTIKELRKNHGLTAHQLADRSGLDRLEILRIDQLKLREIERPVLVRLLPVIRGDYMDRIH